MTGILSERDYVCKIALLGKTSKETKIKEISTKAANIVTANVNDSVEDCMAKMLTKDIRHVSTFMQHTPASLVWRNVTSCVRAGNVWCCVCFCSFLFWTNPKRLSG